MVSGGDDDRARKAFLFEKAAENNGFLDRVSRTCAACRMRPPFLQR
jgi:hypothetical protein